MKLYENVVIGNFLYGLGFSVRGCLQGRPTFPSMINQLQQTPVDKELADVLLNFPGLVRLIEFKRKGADLKKELRRHRLLREALSTEVNAHLHSVSRRVHWYVEVSGKITDVPLVRRAEPYLDAIGSTAADTATGSFEQLIEQTAQEAVGDMSPAARVLAERYIRLLRTTFGNDSASAGGLMLVMSGGGAMRFARLQDLSDLNLPDRQWQERALQENELALAPHTPEQTRVRRMERTIERDRDGPDRSM
ncbi:TPA: hypothetical protein ACNIJL_004704 [Pseudomonas aeruginosa]